MALLTAFWAASFAWWLGVQLQLHQPEKRNKLVLKTIIRIQLQTANLQMSNKGKLLSSDEGVNDCYEKNTFQLIHLYPWALFHHYFGIINLLYFLLPTKNPPKFRNKQISLSSIQMSTKLRVNGCWSYSDWIWKRALSFTSCFVSNWANDLPSLCFSFPVYKIGMIAP